MATRDGICPICLPPLLFVYPLRRRRRKIAVSRVDSPRPRRRSGWWRRWLGQVWKRLWGTPPTWRTRWV